MTKEHQYNTDKRVRVAKQNEQYQEDKLTWITHDRMYCHNTQLSNVKLTI